MMPAERLAFQVGEQEHLDLLASMSISCLFCLFQSVTSCTV